MDYFIEEWNKLNLIGRIGWCLLIPIPTLILMTIIQCLSMLIFGDWLFWAHQMGAVLGIAIVCSFAGGFLICTGDDIERKRR